MTTITDGITFMIHSPKNVVIISTLLEQDHESCDTKLCQTIG
jgi:hypothetical protein